MIVFRTELECNPQLIHTSELVEFTFELRSHRKTDIEIKFVLPIGDTTQWGNGTNEFVVNDTATRFFQDYITSIDVIVNNSIPTRSLILDVIVKDLTDGTTSTSSVTLNIS